MTASKAAKLQNNKALPVTPTAPAEARPVHMFPADLTKPLDAIADPIYLNPLIAFYILAAAHALAALYFPIQDCDEVYNYYEPTHYLTDGYGKQTWEYSPDYAIRSWAYVTLHAFVIGLRRVIPIWGLPKVWKFYFLRIMLGAVCAASEARLYTKISRTLNPRLGMLFFLIMLTSPGMFHASVSFLPSTFSMYTTALGMAAFMDWRGGMRTAQGMMCMIGGAFLGWPLPLLSLRPSCSRSSSSPILPTRKSSSASAIAFLMVLFVPPLYLSCSSASTLSSTERWLLYPSTLSGTMLLLLVRAKVLTSMALSPGTSTFATFC
ncbi:unnamed protein product [Aureobasidium pullulans]|nr:unnamed protein product [Aureobasidium pullulans]